MSTTALLSVAAITLSAGAATSDLTVFIPPGQTRLSDVGMYRVAYQSYGQEPVEMPVSWLGHFTDASGISYAPQERVLERPAILLHSPWRVPPGKVWVDYRLALPEAAPLTLSFGIAMKPDVAVPDRSDGVTFSCYLLDDKGEHELTRLHHAKGEWIDYEFDLAPWAGRTITVRLQTEPGPANSPSWDYSYFSDPLIQAGTAGAARTGLLDELTAARAYRATAGAGLQGVANDSRNGILPGNVLDFRNAIAKDGTAFRFSYEGADCRITYVYEPESGTLDDFIVQVDDGQAFQPALGGGVIATAQGDAPASDTLLRGGKAIEMALSPEGDELRVLWEYPAEPEPVRVAWRFAIHGKALVVHVACEQPVLAAFSLGHNGQTPFRKTLAVPYLEGSVNYLPAEKLFTCRFLDWTVSHASQCPHGHAAYDTKTDGTRNPLLELGYVAVSPNVHEVLPSIPHPPSPYLALLGPCIMLDVWGWGLNRGTFQDNAANLRALKDNGVDHMAIISHVWQRYGYDVKLPDHLPANPEWGGDEGMIAFGKAANDCNYIWSLHENYIDLYPDAPSYDPSARVLRADGLPSPAWFNAGTGVQSFGLKCTRALGYARQNAPAIHRRFGTNAAYLDVHTCVPPWHQLDHEASQPMAAMALAKVQHDTQLFQYMRDTHEGPLFGEGARHFYWAGRFDGAEAQVADGEDHDPFLDFDLLKLHPQMVNHGMGYYERWFRRGYGTRWGFDAGAPEQVDKYRAQEIAYGHAGFIGASQVTNIQWVAKEHHLVHPVQRLAGTAMPTEIAYEVDGRFVSASVALPLGERSRQRIRYDSGLTVWVNWAEAPWEVEGRLLPQWGFLALGPDTTVSTTLHDGRFADYADCPEFLFVDARTSFHMPYLQSGVDIEPRLADFEYLGDNRIRVKYEWIVKEALDEDYHCFVHFTNEHGEASDHIEFQQDHNPPTPTSQWRPGDVIADGPYEIEVPADGFDTYDLLIGLFKGHRINLKGIQTSGARILIGRLQLERDGERIKSIALADLAPIRAQAERGRADFSAHMNPAGTRIDFGPVATDGSVKINRGERALTVFPYPRDKGFTVALDLAAIVPGADTARARVKALAAGTQGGLGVVAHSVEEGRLVFDAGLEGAGRYVVEW
ncbi:MAG: hypothetical protein JXR94_11380 [Candidatus Hydrogenedentes bacterium]|nr:hypothetical protein [Candidatus Hydrogenedentota bacterium]